MGTYFIWFMGEIFHRTESPTAMFVYLAVDHEAKEG